MAVVLLVGVPLTPGATTWNLHPRCGRPSACMPNLVGSAHAWWPDRWQCAGRCSITAICHSSAQAREASDSLFQAMVCMWSCGYAADEG